MFPVRGWRSGLTSTHPAPRQRAGGCHDHVSGGPGCSVRRSSAALAPAHAAGASVPGVWRPSRLHGRRGGVLASAGCIWSSRCQARVSSLRAIAMVANSGDRLAVWAAWLSTQRSQAEPCLSVPPGCVNQWRGVGCGGRRSSVRTVAYVSPGSGCCLVLDETARVTGRSKAGRAATRSALEPGRAHPASSGGGDRGTGSDHMAASPFMG